MSAPHEPSPERPPGQAPGPEREPEGIVEELKHDVGEIGEAVGEAVDEAVEHVPKPVRWTVRKLILLVFAGLVALVVIAIVSLLLYFARRTELVARELTLVLNGVLAQRSDVQLEITNIRGNPLRRVRLIKPRVWFTDGGGPALLEAPWIELQYSPFQWLRRDLRTIDIVIEAPVIRLAKGKDGRIRVPVWRASGSPVRSRTNLDVNLKLAKGSVIVPAPTAPVLDMNLDASVSIGTGTRARLRSLTWADGPFHTRHLRMAGQVEKGDTVRVRLEQLETDDFSVRGLAEWLSGDTTRTVHLDVGRMPWKWLAQVTNNAAFDVPGEAHGAIVARGYRTWNARFHSRVEWKDEVADGEGGARWDHGTLTVKPLHLTSPAGTLDGDFMWNKKAWNVGGEVVHGNPERWGAIGITGWPKGDVQGSFRYAVTGQGRQQSAQLVATLGASELAGWRVDQGTVEVEFPAAGPDSFRVDALRRGGGFALRGSTNPSGWTGAYRVHDLPLDEWPDGRTSGIHGMLGHAEGTVEGRKEGLFVTGELAGTETTWLGMHGARWSVHAASGQLLPKPDLSADARLSDVMYLGLHFDSVATPFALGDQTLALENLAATASDTSLTLAGRASWDQGTWRLALDRARLWSGQFDWRADPPVLLAGDPRGVTFERMTARDSLATVTMSGRWAVPGGSYDWTARAERLDLSRLGLPPEFHLSGTSDAVLRVTGVAGDPRWTLAAAVSKPGWQGHAADSLALDLAGRPSTLDVRHASFRLNGGTARAVLAFERMAKAWPDTLTAAGVQAWLADAGQWHGEIEATAIPLDELKEMMPAARDWSGQVQGKIQIDGRPKEPVLDATFQAEKLSWQAIDLQQVRGRAHYEKERLVVAELRMIRDQRESTASGEMPLKLAVGKTPEVPEAPMSWHVDIPNGDLSIARLVVPQIGSASGSYALRADIRGTPRHPDLSGTLKVVNGAFRMTGREELFEGVTANITLDESRITVDTLTARQGERGRVRGSGVVELAGSRLKDYHFRFTATEITTSEPGFYAVLFDGSFDVTDGPVVHGQRVPYVTGNVGVRRGVILYDFANVSEAEQVAQTAAPLYWTYKIHVTADNNVHWQPPDGDIEFSVNLDIEQKPDALVIYGEMKALRGTYYFLSNRFDITRVDLTFDNVEGVNPLIDAEATTRIDVDNNTRATITVQISGRANEPKIVLASDQSGWDQARILQELTVGRLLAGDARGALGDPFDNYITRAINRTFSAEMSRAFRGYINEWKIERDRGGLIAGQGALIIGVGSQVTPKLALRYRQRLPGLENTTPSSNTSTALGPIERDIEAEYRLSRFIYLTTELTQRRLGTATSATTAPEFNINLKARWEY